MVALLGDGYRRRLSALFVVQRPRAVVVLRGTTFLVTLLAALLVEPQREALTEFLQHALLLALRAMRRILTSAGGHIGDIQDGRRLLQPGMADQRNRGLGQGMLGRHVAARPRPLVLFVAGPMSAAQAESTFPLLFIIRQNTANENRREFNFFRSKKFLSHQEELVFELLTIFFTVPLYPHRFRFNPHKSHRKLGKNKSFTAD